MSIVRSSRHQRSTSIHIALSDVPEVATINQDDQYATRADPSTTSMTPRVAYEARNAERAWESGHLHDANSWASMALQDATLESDDVSSDVAALHRTLSATLLEWCDIQRALTHAFASARELTGQRPSQSRMYTYLQTAAASAAAGNATDALTHLDEARRIALTCALDAGAQDRLLREHVMVLLDIGDIEQAQHWLSGLRQQLSPSARDEALSLRAHVAERSDDAAGDRAIRLLKGLTGDASLRTRIEVGVASAVALEASGRRSEALVIASTTIQLGEAERFTWSLARYRQWILPLLRAVQEHGPHPRQTWSVGYLDRVIRAADTLDHPEMARGWNSDRPYEPLSERELQILRLLTGTLSNREIGAELYLSVNTVKTHVKSVYAKLGVNRRAEAVSRARDLGLLRGH